MHKTDEEVAAGQWDGPSRPTWICCPHCESIAAHDYRTWSNATTGEVAEKHTCGACRREWWVDVITEVGETTSPRKRSRKKKEG